jgi:methionine sulfoxide reductase heme-binding subunit
MLAHICRQDADFPMVLKLPWLDRSGRFSPLKAVVFVALFAPLGLMYRDYLQGLYTARLAMEINHALGLWAIRLLVLTLAITPLRQSLQWPGLIQVRRMIGVAAFCYAVAHFLAYVVDQKFNWWFVAREIVLRFYLTIGFGVLVALLALAVTSTDGMLRRMGGKAWRKLHYLVYPAIFMAIVHYFLQSKAGPAEATVLAGLFGWMMVWRALSTVPGPVGLAILALAAGVLTVAGEAGYYGFFTGIDPMRVLNANWLQLGLRPGWVVLEITLAVAVLALLRQVVSRAERRPVAAGR